MNQKHLTELSEVASKIRNKKEAELFLKDILTPKELTSVVERWQIVKMLMKKVPHRKISKTLKVSIAKVTRGSHAMRKSKGGFKLLFKR